MANAGAFHALFIVYQAPGAEVGEREIADLARAVAALPGLRDAFAFTPMPPGDQPFAKDGRGPALALQFDFATERDADAALVAEGPFASIVRGAGLSSLAGASVAHQRMVGRRFAVSDPAPGPAPVGAACTFLVEYPGSADDPEAWLNHYDAHHPPIMARFPGIRDIATFRPAWKSRNALPGVQATSMQRNKVVFDSVAALERALASPVMIDMRADSARFAPVTHRPTHHVMSTRKLTR
jgi:uncharacterized protein (TIGR02118 family)